MIASAIFPRERVTVVGVLNATPDSFSDGGQLVAEGGVVNVDAAVRAGNVLEAMDAEVAEALSLIAARIDASLRQQRCRALFAEHLRRQFRLTVAFLDLRTKTRRILLFAEVIMALPPVEVYAVESGWRCRSKRQVQHGDTIGVVETLPKDAIGQPLRTDVLHSLAFGTPEFVEVPAVVSEGLRRVKSRPDHAEKQGRVGL